ELLRLHEEFDLADATAPQLDVVSFYRNLAVPLEGVDLPLHRVHVGDRGEVEILAPDEGREAVQDGGADRTVASARPRLDERCPLPVLPGALVVVERRWKRDRDLRRGRIRS